jgi:hypothetical protein
MHLPSLLLHFLPLLLLLTQAADGSKAIVLPHCTVDLDLHASGADNASFSTFPAAYAAAAARAASLADCRTSGVVLRVGAGEWPGPWVVGASLAPPASAAASFPARLTILGSPGAVLTGGVTVGNFSATTSATTVWRASVPPGTNGTQLFVAGVRRPRARSPNVFPGGDPSDPAAAYAASSMHAWASPLCPSCPPADPINARGVVYDAGDGIDPDSWDLSVAEALLFVAPWSTCVQRVRSAFAANRTLLFESPCVYALGQFPASETGRRWMLENVRGALDAGGEWFLNVSEGTLEYVPLPWEVLEGFTAVLTQRGSLLVVAQDGVTVENMTVTYAAVDPGGRGSGFAQTGAVEVGAAGVTLRGLSVLHAGANCVVLRPGVSDVLVAASLLADCGGHGVYMDTQDDARNVTVTDTRVVGVGYTYLTQPTGILLNGGTNISAVHNAIVNSSYTGISVAWMHGAPLPPQPTPAAAPYRFNVSFNRVDSFGLGILSDFGGVRVAINNGDECFVNDTCYVPVLVQNNVVSRGRHFSYGANGIYTDNAVAGVDVVDNMVYDVDGIGVQLHCGANLTLRNNLIYDARATRGGNCTGPQDHYTAVLSGCTRWPTPNGTIPAPFSAAIEGNIVVATSCPQLYGEGGVWPNPGPGYPGGPSMASNMTAGRNVYFNANGGGGPLQFPEGLSFAGWTTASGTDQESVVADPLLADPSAANFTVLPASPAWARGWQAIDTASVGPRQGGRP